MMNKRNACTFRNAKPADAPIISKFLHELAEHDGHGDECHITVNDVIRFGFSEHPKFEVTLIEVEGEPQGLALYFMTFSIWAVSPCLFISDLYVTERCRGLGIGRKLFSYLAAEAKERGCNRMEWQVLHEADAIEFYKSMGGKAVEGFHNYRVEAEYLETLAASADK